MAGASAAGSSSRIQHVQQDTGEKAPKITKGNKGITDLTNQEKVSKSDTGQRRISVSCKKVGAGVIPESGKGATTPVKTSHHIAPGTVPKSNDVEKAAGKTKTMRFMVEIEVPETNLSKDLAKIDKQVVNSILASVENREVKSYFQENRGEIEQMLGSCLKVTYADTFSSIPTTTVRSLAQTIHQGGGISGARNAADIINRGFVFDHSSNTMFCVMRHQDSLADAHRHCEANGIDLSAVNFFVMHESEFSKFAESIASEIARIESQETGKGQQVKKSGIEPAESVRTQKPDVQTKEKSKNKEEVKERRHPEKHAVATEKWEGSATKAREKELKEIEKKVEIEKKELKREIERKN